MNNDLIERAVRLREECRVGVEERGVMPDYVDSCVALKALAPKLLDELVKAQAMQEEVVEPTEAMIDLAERAIEEWITVHDGEEIDCRALARIAVMQGEVGGLREALEAMLTASQPQHTLKHVYPEEAQELARKALAASPPVDQGRIERLEIGARIRCIADNCPSEWSHDWRDWQGYLAGIQYEPGVGLNFTVSDTWPPTSNGDLSDGFREGQLAALTNKGANP